MNIRHIVLMDAGDPEEVSIVKNLNGKNKVFNSHDAADIWVQDNAGKESSCFLIVEID